LYAGAVKARGVCRRALLLVAALWSVGCAGAGGASPDAATPDGAAGADASGGNAEAGADAADAAGATLIHVLVLNQALGFGHQSRVTALPYLQAAAAANGIALELRYAHQTVVPEGTSDLAGSADLSAFVPGGLDGYDVVFFLNTSGSVFQGPDEAVHQEALRAYIEDHHGGFVGTHSASDTYDDTWPWYQDFLGAIVMGHSGYVAASARRADGVSHPILSTALLPEPWARTEEWYVLRRDVRALPGFTVLLLADAPNIMGVLEERPSAWVHDVPGGGRAFYTAFGHAVDAFEEPAFLRLLMTAIQWAAHRLD
jgi:type 1 glutamine amidotransferase